MTLCGPAMEEIKQVQVEEVITKTKGSLDMSVQELQKEFDKVRPPKPPP
jgi:sugar-specific transcriptional regulator TrmB